MQTRAMLDIGLGALVIGLGVFIAGQNSRFLAQVQPQPHRFARPPIPKGPIVYPAIPVQRPLGGPAMHPTRPNEMPAFTTDELRQFLTSTPGALGNKGAPQASISRIDCSLTARKLKDVMQGKNTGLPDDLAVCYVELNGTFTFYGPPAPNSSRGTVLTFHTAFRVFDAKTGNLMLTGAFERPQ
jgi:hypothetical protein